MCDVLPCQEWPTFKSYSTPSLIQRIATLGLLHATTLHQISAVLLMLNISFNYNYALNTVSTIVFHHKRFKNKALSVKYRKRNSLRAPTDR